ncbi:MAG: hypothetical protein GY869_18050, partial [Planctomycetes bacterium]|nr:hypothetical protein [Planctomycetota bacterium]
QSGLWYPKGGDKTLVYAAGLWIGGYVHDAGYEDPLTVTVAQYSYDYTPGQFDPDGNFFDGYDDPAYKVYKIDRGDNEATNPDYANWPFDQGAPYVDENGNGRYDPGEPPLIFGDQTLFSVYTDADPERHINNNGSRFQVIGLEVQQTTFGYNRPGLADVIFNKYKIVNRGGHNLDEAYIMIWSDADLGGARDDYAGCDPDLDVGFCYNASNNDQQYGTATPCVGFQFIQGPLIPEVDSQIVLPDGRVFEGMTTLPMTSFKKWMYGGDSPDNAQETYWFMQGLDGKNNGNQIINPVTGEVTTFMLDGDPVEGTGWLDRHPSNRYIAPSTGPVDLPVWQDSDNDGQAELGEPGVQELVIAVVVGQGVDRLNSVSAMKYNAQYAAYAYWRNFAPWQTPAQPIVTAVELDREIVLYWDDQAEQDQADNPFKFEGYSIYQLVYPGDPQPTWIATFDVVNAVAVIFQPIFEDGVFIDRIVQRGSDSGIQRSFQITEDYINGGPLQNEQTYYYALTAYTYNPDPESTIKSRESPLQDPPLALTPHRPPLDFPFVNDYGDTLDVSHPAGASDGQVRVYVVDPTALTGHDYQVYFKEMTDLESCGYIIDPGTGG